MSGGTLPRAWRLARRELRGGLRGFRLLLACLALGVAAIAAVGSVRSGIEAGLAREGAALLGGDAELDFTYRFATPDERDWMEEQAQTVSEIAEFRSMAVVGETRALTQVKAVDDAYPLIGTVALSPAMPLDVALRGDGNTPGAVMERALIDRLGLAIGDGFRLGDQAFVLSAEILREPDNAAGGFALGPRTILRRDSLAGAGLLSPGTLFNSKYRLLLPPGQDLPTLATDAKQRFAESGMRWQDARNGAPGVARFVERLGAFLILVGLSGLAVGGIGVSAAVRSYLAGKTEVIATLRALGADRATIFAMYFLQIGLLCLVGVALGVMIGALAPLLLAPLIEARLPVPARFALYPAPLAEAALYGTLTALVFTLWPLARIENIRAATLFRDAWSGAARLPAWPYVCGTALAILLLVGLAGWFNGSWWLTLWTLGGIAAALGLLSLTAALIRVIARHLAPRLRHAPRLRWAMAAIGGAGEGAGAVVLSLGLGLSVLAAVGQIDGNLRHGHFRQPSRQVAPSYFFVDIQKDQMPGYTERLENDPAVQQASTAPRCCAGCHHPDQRQTRPRGCGQTIGCCEGDRGVTYAAHARCGNHHHSRRMVARGRL